MIHQRYLILVILALAILLPGNSLAETSSTATGVAPVASPTYDSDYYSGVSVNMSHSLNAQVVFDGEGEALVALDIELGAQDQELRELSIVIPGNSVQIRRALQDYTTTVDTEYCLREGAYDATLHDYPCLEKGTYPANSKKVEQIRSVTAEQSDGLKVTLPLPHTIAVGETTTIALSYRAKGYADNNLGLWRFDYVTPQIPLDIDNIRVRIDTVEGLILKGGSGNVNYRDSLPNELAVSDISGYSDGLSSGFRSAMYNRFAFIKTSSALDANETFTVSGSYAANWWRIYWATGLLLFLTIVALVALIILGERRARRLQESQ